MPSDFRERLKRDILICDGAMGTMLYAKGIFINRCFEELNLSRANLVEETHAEYVKAGADIIETNTFGANRIKLEPHGLADKLKEINRRGIEIARDAAGERTYVAGAIGPLGQPIEPYGEITADQAREVFKEHTEALLEAKPDLIMLETFDSLAEVLIAVEVVKSLTDLTVIAQLTLEPDGRTAHGEMPEGIIRALEKSGVDVGGLNHSAGPKQLHEAVESMRAVSKLPIIAQPNAGLPKTVDNRAIYMCTPEYMAEFAKRMIQSGANIIGGCCGTDPAHIKAVTAAVRAIQPRIGGRLEVAEESIKDITPDGIVPVPREQKSRLARSLADGKFVVSIEIDPPQGTDITKVMEAAQGIHAAGIDAINIADGPRASARMNPISMARIFEKEVGVETIVHYCCRDRNILGMQADLLGANALGQKNILLITGDPPKLGDYPDATAVYDVDAIGLTRIATKLNHGLDLAGNPIGAPTAFHIGVGANPGAIDIDLEVERYAAKVAAGAEYVLTQPAYRAELFFNFLEKIKDIPKIPILVGLLPLASYRNAEFLHKEVPGMQIPDQIRERMRKVGGGPEGRSEGIKIAREALKELAPFVQGCYIMPPFNRYKTALEILEVLGSDK